jgi:endoglucanase
VSARTGLTLCVLVAAVGLAPGRALTSSEGVAITGARSPAGPAAAAADAGVEGGAPVVTNGSMTDGGEAPAGWTAQQPHSGQVRLVRDTEQFVEGPASLRLESVGGPLQDGKATLKLERAAGRTFTIAAWVRSTGSAWSGPRRGEGIRMGELAMLVQDSEWKQLAWQTICPQKTLYSLEWVKFATEVTVPAEAHNVLLVLYFTGEGAVWLDELTVRVGPPLVPRPATFRMPRTDRSPVVSHVGAVAPDILGITIDEGRRLPGQIVPYEPREGDEVLVKNRLANGDVQEAVLKRDGEEVAWVIGKGNDYLCTFERREGDALQADWAVWPRTYTVMCPDDPAYAEGAHPVGVWRKSKPTDWILPSHAPPPARHYVYLRLPAPLRPDLDYTVDFGDLNVREPSASYRHAPSETRSEAVHAIHTGYRPDDPGKRGYLSVWLGDGGAHSYGEGVRFRLVDAASGRAAYEGTARLAFAAADPERMKRRVNHNKTDVYHLDFGSFSSPGDYRLVVDGIGASYPFVIGDGPWRDAFVASMRGFYHQRSGLALGPPRTDFVRPRNFHPRDGVRIRETSVRLGEGWFDELMATATERTVDAWGGYHDAGDWDRHTGHLVCSVQHLELLELFPDFFAALDHNIPECGDDVPDLLDEALWNIDLYRRLQTPEGGVRGGIESSAHPRAGEVSWMESLTVMAFAPDVLSSYRYAAAAAMAAQALRRWAPSRAPAYEESALRAMEWAEAQLAGDDRARDEWRALAAVALYRLTGDVGRHELFKSAGALAEPGVELRGVRGHAAFLYARLPDGQVDAALKRAAVERIVAVADGAVEYAGGNAFNVTHPVASMPVILGFFSTPHVEELAWAHHLTGEPKYLETMVRACNYGLGANPMNVTLTTGLGHDWPRNPLHIDSRRTGQPAPEGITLYGNNDFPWEEEDGGWLTWPFKWFLNRECYPDGNTWPVAESYFDIYGAPSMNEFTVHQNLGPASYAWGYLAARP